MSTRRYSYHKTRARRVVRNRPRLARRSSADVPASRYSRHSRSQESLSETQNRISSDRIHSRSAAKLAQASLGAALGAALRLVLLASTSAANVRHASRGGARGAGSSALPARARRRASARRRSAARSTSPARRANQSFAPPAVFRESRRRVKPLECSHRPSSITCTRREASCGDSPTPPRR